MVLHHLNVPIGEVDTGREALCWRGVTVAHVLESNGEKCGKGPEWMKLAEG